ncbi:MAG: glycosyltransferase [Vulcanimicrobiaceae bacterium]
MLAHAATAAALTHDLEARTSRLRVVHIVANLKEGGAEALVRQLCPRLGRYGIDPSVIAVYGSNLSPEETVALGVPVVEIGRRSRRDLGFFPRLVNRLRTLDSAIVHAHITTGKFAGRSAAVLAGVPRIVFTEHGDLGRSPVRTALNAVLHPRTDRFIVFSEGQRTDLIAAERVPASKVRIIPNGVSLPDLNAGPIDRLAIRAELGVDPGELAFIIPARITEIKNQTLAISALAGQEQIAGRRWRLFLAGQGPAEAECRAIAAAAGVADRVRFLGFRDDVARLLPAVDGFLMPSRFEWMPLALGEAMLAGTPVVTAPWRYAGSFVRDGETGFVSADWSAPAFARAIERAVTPGDAGRRIVENARAFARATFDIEIAARRHAELYRELIEAPH